MKQTRWEAPDEVYDNWKDMDIEALKFIFEQARIKLDEILSESEKITERTTKLLSLFLIVAIILFGSRYSKPPHPFFTAVEIVLGVLDILLFGFLLFGVKVVLRGTAPATILTADLVTKYKDHQHQRVYFEEIVRLQRAINTNRANIANKRAWYYCAVAVSFLMFAGAGVLILQYISAIVLP